MGEIAKKKYRDICAEKTDTVMPKIGRSFDSLAWPDGDARIKQIEIITSAYLAGHTEPITSI